MFNQCFDFNPDTKWTVHLYFQSKTLGVCKIIIFEIKHNSILETAYLLFVGNKICIRDFPRIIIRGFVWPETLVMNQTLKVLVPVNRFPLTLYTMATISCRGDNHYYIQSINQKCYYYAEKRIRSLQSLEHVTSRELE